MQDVLAAVRDEVRALVEQIAPHETTTMRNHFAARVAQRVEARLSPRVGIYKAEYRLPEDAAPPAEVEEVLRSSRVVSHETVLPNGTAAADPCQSPQGDQR